LTFALCRRHYAAVPVAYRAELATFLDDFAAEHRGVRRGKMFGLPAIYVGRRLVTCLIEDGIIVRLPEDLARREVRARRGKPFSGRFKAKGTWVMYTPRSATAAARSLSGILENAIRHIAEQQTDEITGIRLRRTR
jgi:hypothetical protein